jgi:N-dimethylarginine dimethylaminohydrolase
VETSTIYKHYFALDALFQATEVWVRNDEAPGKTTNLMPRTIVMGDPRHFSVRGGANPHTRNVLGVRKTVDARRAQQQWHAMANALIERGVEVLIVEPHEHLPGLVYPANAGFLHPLQGVPADRKIFYLANLLPTRAPEREVYRAFIRSLGISTRDVRARFEGEADFFPAGDYLLFTHGQVERQRFVLRFGLPPWKRIYGFRSDAAALGELTGIAAERKVLSLELRLEAYYHGDTVLCSIGPRREFLLAYLKGLTAPSSGNLRRAFGANLIPLSDADAALYAANSFQIERDGRLFLFMPQGVSESLCRQVQERGINPVLIDVSEFLAKGGGSIKCMILDLGPSAELSSSVAAASFRADRSYQNLFPKSY